MKISRYLKMMVLFVSPTIFPLSLHAGNVMEVSSESGDFCLFAKGKAATVCVSPTEPLVVQKVAQLFAEDVERVTGIMPEVTSQGSGTGSVPVLTIATLGHNARVDKLVAKGRLDVSGIKGGWEQFVIRTLGKELFIVGSDRRGTAYGVFTLSEQMGVSPWYWWADVPVPHRDALYVSADIVSKEPSVRYRGIFINDEDWGLKPWAAKNYEKELGDIGPRTYARVCELLLRLKANMLAPAMHSCTGAFYSHPESKVVCDSFGIVITTSHCEPLLLNNAAESEWDQQRDGDWNYKTNSETILKKWDDRLSEASQYENIYTVAMRGLHDAGLRGNLPMEERVPLIEKVISDQRALLAKHHVYSPLSNGEVPQIFVPYKETMDIYENGLRVPDDITLVWVDDNYGYMKRVSSPEEQKRSGHSGVYYHLSYLGAPHDYLWLNTTPPVLMYEELKKAYDAGGDRYWLLNVGDIKPMELGIQTFMDMAWDFSTFDFKRAYTHQSEFLAKLFSFNLSPSTLLLDTFYRLAWSRKPEFMGWEYEWDDKEHTGLKPTEYSFKNYAEAQQRLADYQRISDEVERLSEKVRVNSEKFAAAFFQLLQFPVQAAYQMNRKFLMAQLNQELAAEGRHAEANWAAHQAKEAYDSINALNRRYNELLDGKWRGMMALSTSFTNTCQYYQMPEVTYTDGVGERPVDLTPRSAPTKDCLAVNLANFHSKSDDTRLVTGLGYDWQVVQLGTVTYSLPSIPSDSITVQFSTLPFWPLYAGKSNRVGVSVDGGKEQMFENTFKEYSRTWKDQVMRNGALCRLRFAIDKNRERHSLTFRGIDAGQMLQQVVIDWGGLQPSYMGPSAAQTLTIPSPPEMEFLMQLRVTLGAAYSLGDTPHGRRNVVPITGGTFEGPHIRGAIIPGGADYQLSTENGRHTELEAIYSIQADDGTIIHVRNKGVIAQGTDSRGNKSFSFLAAPLFEAPTNSPYAWLNNSIYVCQPDFTQQFNGIVMNVWRIRNSR